MVQSNRLRKKSNPILLTRKKASSIGPRYDKNETIIKNFEILTEKGA